MLHTHINFVKGNLRYATVYTPKIDSLRFLLCFRSSLGPNGQLTMHLQHTFVYVEAKEEVCKFIV